MSEQIPAPPPLQSHSRQNAASERAKINADAIGLLVRFTANAVAVDDDLAVIAEIVEKFLTDPAEIRKRLLFERNAGAYTGMNENIIANFNQIFATAEEIDMIRRHQRGEVPGDVLKARALEILIVAPIAADRRIATDPHEITDAPYIARQCRKKAFLVIADQQAGIGKLVTQPHRALDDLRRFWAAIDQITQQDNRYVCLSTCRVVGADHVEHLGE